MKRNGKEFARWSLLAMLIGAGMFAFLILVGEETPDNPMNIGEFFVLKFGALVTIYGVVLLCKHLCKRGLLPQSFIDEITKEEI